MCQRQQGFCSAQWLCLYSKMSLHQQSVGHGDCSQSEYFLRCLLGPLEPQNEFSFPLRLLLSVPGWFLMLHSSYMRVKHTISHLGLPSFLSLLSVKTVPSGCSGYAMQNLPASAWSRTCWLVARILDLGTLAAGKLCSPSAACWVCQRVLGNVPWWVEAHSASEVVAVAVGGSSDLAHVASSAWGILCAACSSAAVTQPTHLHWLCNCHTGCPTGVSQLIQGNFN